MKMYVSTNTCGVSLILELFRTQTLFLPVLIKISKKKILWTSCNACFIILLDLVNLEFKRLGPRLDVVSVNNFLFINYLQIKLNCLPEKCIGFRAIFSDLYKFYVHLMCFNIH